MVEVLDLELGVRHRLTVRDDHTAKDTTHPIRVRLIERQDLSRQTYGLGPQLPGTPPMFNSVFVNCWMYLSSPGS